MNLKEDLEARIIEYILTEEKDVEDNNQKIYDYYDDLKEKLEKLLKEPLEKNFKSVKRYLKKHSQIEEAMNYMFECKCFLEFMALQSCMSDLDYSLKSNLFSFKEAFYFYKFNIKLSRSLDEVEEILEYIKNVTDQEKRKLESELNFNELSLEDVYVLLNGMNNLYFLIEKIIKLLEVFEDENILLKLDDKEILFFTNMIISNLTNKLEEINLFLENTEFSTTFIYYSFLDEFIKEIIENTEYIENEKNEEQRDEKIKKFLVKYKETFKDELFILKNVVADKNNEIREKIA